MFELYHNKNPSGSLAEVWMDKKAGLVKKLYKPDGITVSGNTTVFKDLETVRTMYENELVWNERLKSEWLLEIYEHGELDDQPGFYVIQEYVGPDLLHYYDDKVLKEVDDPIGQIVEMFRFFKKNNVYKLNNAMSNMVNDKGRIRVFDFKYSVERSPEFRPLEVESINKWISKIDPSLKDTLQEFI